MEDSYHPMWPSQTTYDSNNLSTTPVSMRTQTLASLVGDDTMDPKTSFGQQQQHPTIPQHGLRDTYSSNTTQNNSSVIYFCPDYNLGRHSYPDTTSHGQAEDVPTQSMTGDVYRLARNPTHHSAHAGRVVENGWSAPFQPIEQRPGPNLKFNGLDSHPYIRQH